MRSLLWLFNTLIWLFIWILIVRIVMDWLIAFNIINAQQPVVRMIGKTLWHLTEPFLEPIRGMFRRFLPAPAGLDLSPLILTILLIFASMFITEIFAGLGWLGVSL